MERPYLGARNRSIVDKVAAVFESYWEAADFEPTTPSASRPPWTGTGRTERLVLSPTEIRPYPFQERLLEQIELSRERGHHRNLLVAATGTGKTVMAALDYQRLRTRLAAARLLFVAHREEILTRAGPRSPTRCATRRSARSGSAAAGRRSSSTSSRPSSR
jgi:superfamily II DNA or RNA helicase